MSDLMEEMEDLESAEDFLEFFAIPYEKTVVHVNRLHILQRFHNYLAESAAPEGVTERDHYAACLQRAYQDFVTSDARTEKVLKVFRMNEPQVAFVPLTSLTRSDP